MKLCRVPIALLMMLVVPANTHASDNLPSAQSVLRDVGNCFSLPVSYQYAATETYCVIDTPGSERPPHVTTSLVQKRRDQLAVEQSYPRRIIDGAIQPGMIRKAVVNPDNVIDYQRRIISETAPEDRIAFYSPRTDSEERVVLWIQNAGRGLDGFLAIDGGKSVVEIMGSARPVIDRDGTLLRLRSSSEYGQHTLWVDPQHGNRPVKVHVRKQAGHILYDQPLPSDLSSIEGTLTDFEYQVIGDVTVPVAVSLLEERYLKGKPVQTVRAKHRRSKIELGSEIADTAFALSVPDGTPVIWKDRPNGLQYIWSGGKPTVKMDSDAIKTIDQTVSTIDPFPRSVSGRWWDAMLWTLGALLVVLAAVMIGWRTLRRSQG